MSDNKYRSNNNIVFLCKYHVVFCPKRRKKVLSKPIRERFKELTKNVCNDINVEILAMELKTDHIHLCLFVDPQFGIHKVIKRIKGVTSRYLRKEFPQLLKLPTLWTNSYFVSTVGDVSTEKVLEYIKNQWQK